MQEITLTLTLTLTLIVQIRKAGLARKECAQTDRRRQTQKTTFFDSELTVFVCARCRKKCVLCVCTRPSRPSMHNCVRPQYQTTCITQVRGQTFLTVND